jgi:site-specific recombinase XerD
MTVNLLGEKMIEQETITTTDTINLEMAIETFIQIETMGKAPKTKLWYRDKLDKFANQIGGKNRSINSIIEIDLFAWYEKLEKSKLKPDTRHGYIRAIRKFYKFLHRRDLLPIDLARDLRLPKLPKRTRKGISDENVKKILKAAKNNPRDFALLNFLESTNARRGGIADLKISNLFLDEKEPLRRRAIIHEKGDVDRTVVMSHQTYRALVKWLKVRDNNCDHVFTTAKGTPLTPSGISEILDRYKERLKIKEPCSPHQWRHRWCRKQLQNKMPIPQVSQLAGHKSITVTADFYGTFAIDELHEAFDRYYKPP